ncbi:MAG TPA: phasin [Xanthobacteraceae bacterium]|jgi:phasin|nr:phasin [Xanthobacteraceae bacterium]
MATPPGMEITPEMRAFAERSVEQARQAFSTYMDAATKALSSAEGSADAVQGGARELGRTVMGFTEDNVAAAFGFVERLVKARDPMEIMRLQAEFAQAQMKAFSEQAKALGATAGKAATEAAAKAKSTIP